MTAKEKMIKARAALILDQRFFGALALKLIMFEDETCKTMWTDGVSLGYNPTWVDTLTMDDTKFWICHEVFHCASGHHLRRNGRDNEDWNVACDHATNNMLKSSGFAVPKNALCDYHFANDSAEGIYNVLKSRKPKNDGNQNGGQGGNQQQQGQPQPQQGNTPQNGGQGQGQESCGEVRDLPATDGKPEPTPTEKSQNEQEWKIATNQAAKTAEGCGQMRGGMQQMIKDMNDPKVPWTEVLQRFVDQISHNDYSYARTNPRYAAMGVILPSLYDKTLPPIDVWIDTSGSISEDDKKQAVAEINDIRRHYKTKIRIIYCDTEVCGTEIIEADDELKELHTKGGGGTDFAPAIRWSVENEEPPVCGIFFTDMECDSFGPEPDFPVLWIQTKGRRQEPPFGELTVINPKTY